MIPAKLEAFGKRMGPACGIGCRKFEWLSVTGIGLVLLAVAFAAGIAERIAKQGHPKPLAGSTAAMNGG